MRWLWGEGDGGVCVAYVHEMCLGNKGFVHRIGRRGCNYHFAMLPAKMVIDFLV